MERCHEDNLDRKAPMGTKNDISKLEDFYNARLKNALKNGNARSVSFYEKELERFRSQRNQERIINSSKTGDPPAHGVSVSKLLTEKVTTTLEQKSEITAVDLPAEQRPQDRSLLIYHGKVDGARLWLFDDNLFQWNPDNRLYENLASIPVDLANRESFVPDGFRLRANLPLRSIRSFKPRTGFPPLILEKARRSSRSENVQKTVALLDMLLYSSVMARVPIKVVKKMIGWNTLEKLLTGKLESGEWELVAREKRFTDPKTGKPSGLATVYAISPRYLLQILESDLSSGRYPTIKAHSSRKGFNPDGRRVQYSESIPDDVREYLGQGTGLRANPVMLLHMLLEPVEYQSVNYSSLDVWEKALHGWNTLSPFFHGQLRTSWKLGKNGWLYDSKPALQQLSKMVRMLSLDGINGEAICEVDFSGCQLNIARAMAGAIPVQDPYVELQSDVMSLGVSMSRAQVKEHSLAILGGRRKEHYESLLRRGFQTDPVSYYSAIYDSLKQRGYPINDIRVREAQGRIMMDVMRRVAQETGYTGLSVFDAILLPASFSEMAKINMQEASEVVLGTPLPFKTTPSPRLIEKPKTEQLTS